MKNGLDRYLGLSLIARDRCQNLSFVHQILTLICLCNLRRHCFSRCRLRTDMYNLRCRLQTDMCNSRCRLRTDMCNSRCRLRTHYWQHLTGWSHWLQNSKTSLLTETTNSQWPLIQKDRKLKMTTNRNWPLIQKDHKQKTTGSFELRASLIRPQDFNCEPAWFDLLIVCQFKYSEDWTRSL